MRLLALCLILGALPSASIAETLSACVNNATGAMRMRDSGFCTRFEREVIWNAVGPAGPAGPPGPAGAGAGIAFVVDANNKKIGLYAAMPVFQVPGVVLNYLGAPLGLFVIGQSIIGGPHNLYFDQDGCVGTAYINVGGILARPFSSMERLASVGPPGQTLYVADQASVLTDTSVRSYFRSLEQDCTTGETTLPSSFLAPPVTDLNSHFTAPYRIIMDSAVPALP